MKQNKGKENQGTKLLGIRLPWLIFIIVMIIASAIYFLRPSAETETYESNLPANQSPPVSVANVQTNKLAGRWQRSDGGYIIELKNPTPEGLIDASYFNPNPINVGKSAWQNKAGKLMVLVELRDQNYPGSIYNLEYQPQGDRLTGIYFQAVEKVSYNVEFTRAR